MFSSQVFAVIVVTCGTLHVAFLMKFFSQYINSNQHGVQHSITHPFITYKTKQNKIVRCMTETIKSNAHIFLEAR